MKKAVIVHCWTGYPEYCWYPYVKRELENRGYHVNVPFFANELPLLDSWVYKLAKIVGNPGEDALLIGHSLGAVAVLKYLQSLSHGSKVCGVVLVSGFIDDLGIRPLMNFFTEPLDFPSIKPKSNNFVVIASADDQYIQPYHGAALRTGLDAWFILKASGGHFTESADRVQLKELPEVVSAVDRIAHKKSRLYNIKQLAV